MTFKESVADDLDNVFFDMDEFAEMHNIDGKDVCVVLTDTTFVDAKAGQRSRASFNQKESAINRSGYLLYVREKDVRKRFTVNAMIKLDGTTMFVQSVTHYPGFWKLKIGKYQV